ncbi:MAG: PLP-dependent aspartate aminotransferase family protein [Acidimicrobiales bacterium]
MGGSSTDRPGLRAATRAVTSGRSHEPGGPVNPGIAMSSTFRHGGPDVYARDANDTWEAFEGALGDLEGGTALAFASGMAAISAVFETLPVAATVVVARGCYNGTTKWCADAAARGRLTVRTVDVTDTPAVVAASAGAALVWLESPTNPTLDIADIAPIVAGARACGALVAVDNTLATPLRQQPLTLGADVVVHSVTKWIAGHSDLLMGAAVSADADLVAALRSRRTLYGAIPGSFDAWLSLRGLRTLPARLDRAEASAEVLASRLEGHPGVERVRYPGLESHPGYAVALRQTTGPGAMVSFVVRGGADRAEAVTAGLEVLTPGTSLGGVETLIERRGRYAFEETTPPGLLRMSVGQEDVEDLWEDLDRSLRTAAG